MLVRLIIALACFAALTVWLVIRQDRKEQKSILELEAEVFGD